MLKWAAMAGLAAATVVLIFFAWAVTAVVIGGAQDRPRANDRVLERSISPDGALEAFLVMRIADSLSADVIKVFVAPRGNQWFDGRMMMVGRRFSDMQGLYWVNGNRLCLIASEDGVEEQRDRARFRGREVSFILRPTPEACG